MMLNLTGKPSFDYVKDGSKEADILRGIIDSWKVNPIEPNFYACTDSVAAYAPYSQPLAINFDSSDLDRLIREREERDRKEKEEKEKVEEKKFKSCVQVEKIIRQGIATIVFWGDGTKTIVKRSGDEHDSVYSAFTAALAKKIYGTNSGLTKMIQKKTRYKDKKGPTNIGEPIHIEPGDVKLSTKTLWE